MPSSVVAHAGLPKIHGRVRISDCCSVDFDLHNAVDDLQEIELPAHSIGTMRRGVGPACSPRVSVRRLRRGLAVYVFTTSRARSSPFCEVFNAELFERKLGTLAASAPEGGRWKLQLVSRMLRLTVEVE
ncbi:hypothetical protein BN1708_011402 [Verticillium longisporum]|uniref:Uncharacterized protein n=1 Tax=Verticillium longisporum TaxID=100787 RepID=A0A0G4KZN7_VERLO|nr:hypothetical protein BN1708_011402 [Verticillium longisporum]